MNHESRAYWVRNLIYVGLYLLAVVMMYRYVGHSILGLF